MCFLKHVGDHLTVISVDILKGSSAKDGQKSKSKDGQNSLSWEIILYSAPAWNGWFAKFIKLNF